MEKTLTYDNPIQLAEAYGNQYENIELAQTKLGITITTRDGWIKFEGDQQKVEDAAKFFDILANARKQGIRIRTPDFRNMLNRTSSGKLEEIVQVFENPIVINLKRKSIVPKNINQKRYLKYIGKNDIVFGIGPAGTGKTYLAVAAALKALQDKSIEKIILTRPAVEAGEALGFLPGDLQEKLLPYLRPLYDAMYDMLGAEETMKLIERNVIEIAPLAYMRGRTLANAFVILDEAQNTTIEQMMMFLTRLGENSRMIITGDITQIDLPRNKKSGLKSAMEILKGIEGIKLFHFEPGDVVRHRLVTQIIQAYENAYNKENV
ncbi:MAG: phosphate starvation-inducible protein PhoH [Verrucomicrobiaceae bacterium]|nr:phosphate starvation-inducible protein PhoH [Verrucomicrobiaceae bacterium]